MTSQQEARNAVFRERNVSSIALLERSRNPRTILRTIVLIVISSLQRKSVYVSRFLGPLEKSIESVPVIANCNPTSVIVSISRMVVTTPANHCVPDEIEPSFLARLSLSVLSHASCRQFPSETSARSGVAVFQRGGTNYDCAAAVAKTKPSSGTRWTIFDTGLYQKAFKSKSFKFSSFSHAVSAPMFTGESYNSYGERRQ